MATERPPKRISMDDDIDEFANPDGVQPNMYELTVSHSEVEQLAAKGWDMKRIAKHYGVSPDHFYRWASDHPGLRAAFMRGREFYLAQQNVAVERALLKRAKGFRVKEKEILHTPKGTRVKEIVKYHPPSTKAAEFWLVNRAPERWKRRTEIDISGGLEIVFRNFEDTLDVQDTIAEPLPPDGDFGGDGGDDSME